jgi:HEAT repeat protein
MHKKDPDPERAVAATFLAHDPDAATSKALLEATKDNDWIVRAAAVEAIAQRGDPSLLRKCNNGSPTKIPKCVLPLPQRSFD